MEKTITLTSDEIYNITSAINDRIILLEETISSHNDIPITHKRLKEFNEIMAKEVHVILKGDCYSMNTYCSTLKEFLEMRNLKRSDVSDWWKE